MSDFSIKIGDVFLTSSGLKGEVVAMAPGMRRIKWIGRQGPNKYTTDFIEDRVLHKRWTRVNAETKPKARLVDQGSYYSLES